MFHNITPSEMYVGIISISTTLLIVTSVTSCWAKSQELRHLEMFVIHNFVLKNIRVYTHLTEIIDCGSAFDIFVKHRVNRCTRSWNVEHCPVQTQ